MKRTIKNYKMEGSTGDNSQDELIWPIGVAILTAIWTPVALLTWLFIPDSDLSSIDDWTPFIVLSIISTFIELQVLLLFIVMQGMTLLIRIFICLFILKVAMSAFLIWYVSTDGRYVKWPLFFIVSSPWFITLICAWRVFYLGRIFYKASASKRMS